MRLIQQARPPANSTIRLTPEKEEENNQKTIPDSGILDSITELTYLAVDDTNDPDFGKNGFLSADRFRSGDCLPLINDQIPENFDLPKLEFCGYVDCNRTKIDSFDDKKKIIDERSILEEGKAFETKGINKSNTSSKSNNTITTIAQSNTTTTTTTLGNNRNQLNDRNRINSDERKLYFQQNTPQHRQVEIDNGQNRTIEKKRRKPQSKEKAQIIKPQEEPGYVGHKDVEDIMKTMGFEQPQQKQQRSQKATSPGNGVNVGTTVISPFLSINCVNSSTKKQISKKQKQKPRQIQQEKNISYIKQQDLNKINTLVNGNKITLSTSISLDGNAVELDEELDVGIELDNNDELIQKQGDDNKIINEFYNDNKKNFENEQDKQEVKEVKKDEKEQKDVQQKQCKQSKENKPKWTSSRLDEKKRLWKQKIEETPLIERIPKNLLVSLGWSNPVTILSPFVSRINDKKPLNAEEARKIWEQNPAPEHLLEKTFINQKFAQNVNSKQKGQTGRRYFNKSRKQLVSNNRRTFQ